VERDLQAHPEHRYAFDVTDAPLKATTGERVSVVLAVRHGDHILSGEILIARERFQLALFLQTVEGGAS